MDIYCDKVLPSILPVLSILTLPKEDVYSVNWPKLGVLPAALDAESTIPPPRVLTNNPLWVPFAPV